MRAIFDEAKRSAPSLIFIDEIDSIAAKREQAHKDMERRIVSQLMACMDEISNDDVFIIGTQSEFARLTDPTIRCYQQTRVPGYSS